MADSLDDALANLRYRADAWRSASATIEQVRSVGKASAALVQEVEARFRAGGSRELSARESQAVQDLKDATEAMARATDAEAMAREAWSVASREYQKQELAWAERSLWNYASRRLRAGSADDSSGARYGRVEAGRG